MVAVASLLVVCLALWATRCDAVKCYSRTLSNCNTKPALYYRIVARNDTPIDLRLGPVAERIHDWHVMWVSECDRRLSTLV